MQVSVHDVQQRVAGASILRNIVGTSNALVKRNAGFLTLPDSRRHRDDEDALTSMHRSVDIHLCFPCALAVKLEFPYAYLR